MVVVVVGVRGRRGDGDGGRGGCGACGDGDGNCGGVAMGLVVAAVVAVVGVVVVVVVVVVCWAYICIDSYVGVAVERGTHSFPSARWSYPIGTDWATVVQTLCGISPIVLGVLWDDEPSWQCSAQVYVGTRS